MAYDARELAQEPARRGGPVSLLCFPPFPFRHFHFYPGGGIIV